MVVFEKTENAAEVGRDDREVIIGVWELLLIFCNYRYMVINSSSRKPRAFSAGIP